MAIVGRQLDKGAPLPDVTWDLLDGATFNLVSDLEPRWTVIIILRGHW
jgi:hypothetical protein